MRPPTLVTDQDAWVSSGQVDPATGEVLAEELEGLEEVEEAAA